MPDDVCDQLGHDRLHVPNVFFDDSEVFQQAAPELAGEGDVRPVVGQVQ